MCFQYFLTFVILKPLDTFILPPKFKSCIRPWGGSVLFYMLQRLYKVNSDTITKLQHYNITITTLDTLPKDFKMETSLFRCQLVKPLEEWKEIRLKKPQRTETQKLQQGQQACFIYLRIKIGYAVEVICGRNSFYVFFFLKFKIGNEVCYVFNGPVATIQHW